MTPAKKAPAKKAAKRAPRKAPARVIEVEVENDDQAYDAHQLRLGGMPWREVAEQTGYASPDAATMAVRALLDRAVIEAGKEARAAALATELDRLDALMRPYWTPALHGDLDAAKFVLAVSAQRGKFQKLEIQDESASATRTIVVRGESNEYIGQLKQVAAQLPGVIDAE